MWDINPGCRWELLSACRALAGSGWTSPSSRELPQVDKAAWAPWLTRAGNVKRISSFARFLALPASSLTGATSRTVLWNVCLQGPSWIRGQSCKGRKPCGQALAHTVLKFPPKLFPTASFSHPFHHPCPISSQCLKKTLSYFEVFYFFIIVVLGVHCDIYKSSYNISLLNSSFHHSPFSPLPHSWNTFNRSNFSIFIHVYIIYLLYSPYYTLSLYPPPSCWYQLTRQYLFHLPVLPLC
jgi:hypothetical protein